MEGNMNAEIRFNDGPWMAVRAKHIETNLYMIILPFGTPLPQGLLKSLARVDIRIEGQPATYMHSDKLRITMEGEVILLAITEPGDAWS